MTSESDAAPPPASAHANATPERPWLGLRAYTQADAAYFYGRDAEIRELYERICSNPLTVLYGRSGLGKSSLLGAGLLPKLKVEGRRAVLIRLRFDPDAPPLSAQVHAALASAIDDPAWHGGPSLWTLAHQPASRETLDLLRPVLVFDQFEELFTLGQSPERRDQTQAVLAELSELIENRAPVGREVETLESGTSALRVVLTLREDYLHQLERHKRHLPALMRNRMELLELSGPNALQAVLEPARKITLPPMRTDSSAPLEPAPRSPLLERPVAEAIVRHVAGRSPDTPLDEIDAVPPLLSLLCAELNAARIEAGAPQITQTQLHGEADQVLERFYQRSFDGMPVGVRRAVEDLLIDNGGRIREASSRDTVLSEMRGHGVEDPERYLAALVDGRLLTIEERAGAPRVELTHDLLVPLVARAREKREAEEKAEAERREVERVAVVERERLAVAELAAKQAKIAQRKSQLLSIAIATLGSLAGTFGWFAKEQAKLAEARALELLEERADRLRETHRANQTQHKLHLGNAIRELMKNSSTISADNLENISKLRADATDLKDEQALSDLAHLVARISENERASTTSSALQGPSAQISAVAISALQRERSALQDARQSIAPKESRKSELVSAQNVIDAQVEAQKAVDLGRLNEASATYSKALALANKYAQLAGPEDRWGQLMAADILREHGGLLLNSLKKPEEAIEIFEQSLAKAKELKKGNDQAWRLFAPMQPLAYAYRAKGDIEQAKVWFARAYAAALLTDGHNGLETGKNGNSLSALINWGNFLIEHGDHQGALQRADDAWMLFMQLERSDPTNKWIAERGPDVLRQKAKAHEGLKQFDEAIVAFERAESLAAKQSFGDPKLPPGVNLARIDALFCLARVLRSSGDEERAKVELGRAKEVVRSYLVALPEDELAKWFSLEIERLQQGKPTTQEIGDAFQFAMGLRSANEFNEASAGYLSALILANKYAQLADPEDRWGQLIAADILREHGELLLNSLNKPEEAIKAFEQSLARAKELKKGNDQALRLFAPMQPLAYAYRAKGDIEQAKVWFAKAYAAALQTDGHNGLEAGKNGNSLSALINWGNFLIEHGDHQGALQRADDAWTLFMQLERSEPTNKWIVERGPDVLRQKARAHEGLKQFDEAIVAFERAESLAAKQAFGDPKLPPGVNLARIDALFCLARVLRSSGDEERAKVELGRAKEVVRSYLAAIPEDGSAKWFLSEILKQE